MYLQTKISIILPICLFTNFITGNALIDFWTPSKTTIFEPKYIGKKYRNYCQNLVLKSELKIMKQQKQLRIKNVEEFALIFQKQTLSFAGIAKILA